MMAQGYFLDHIIIFPSWRGQVFQIKNKVYLFQNSVLRGKWKIISPTLLCICKFHHYDHTALGPIITLANCLTRLNSVPSFVFFLPLHVFSIFVGHPIKFGRYFVLLSFAIEQFSAVNAFNSHDNKSAWSNYYLYFGRSGFWLDVDVFSIKTRQARVETM